MAQNVDPADGVKLLAMLDLNAYVANKGAAYLRGQAQFDAPTFELSMARKDVRLMVEAVGAQHAPNLIVLPAVAARMDQLIAQGLGSKDNSVLGMHLVHRRQ